MEVYVLDSYRCGISRVFKERADAISYVLGDYVDNKVDTLRDYEDCSGKVITVKEQIKQDLTQLIEEGYIEDTYWIYKVPFQE